MRSVNCGIRTLFILYYFTDAFLQTLTGRVSSITRTTDIESLTLFNSGLDNYLYTICVNEIHVLNNHQLCTYLSIVSFKVFCA